jgi:hypothetical protein
MNKEIVQLTVVDVKPMTVEWLLAGLHDALTEVQRAQRDCEFHPAVKAQLRDALKKALKELRRAESLKEDT